MGAEIDFKSIDSKLQKYIEEHKEFICCRAGCSDCCEKGDYPISEEELKYLMLGYSKLENSKKILVQQNIKNMVKGGACPFLIDKMCSVYPYRPIICRIHGLAFLMKNGVVKVPYCANNGKNYAQVYQKAEFLSEPISEDLDELWNSREVRNLYDWFNQ